MALPLVKGSLSDVRIYVSRMVPQFAGTNVIRPLRGPTLLINEDLCASRVGSTFSAGPLSPFSQPSIKRVHLQRVH